MKLLYQDKICLVDSRQKKEQAIQLSFNDFLERKKTQINTTTDLLSMFNGTCLACQISEWKIIKKESELECKVWKSLIKIEQSEIYGYCKCAYRENVSLKQQITDLNTIHFVNLKTKILQKQPLFWEA